MLSALTSLIFGSPVKMAMWFGNRAVAGTSMLLIWQRIKHAPDRIRQFLLWFLVVNACSIAVFAVCLYVLKLSK